MDNGLQLYSWILIVHIASSLRAVNRNGQVSTTSNPNWDGPHVNFLASATELNIQGHDTAEQKLKNLGQTHNHNFPYIDDIDQDNMKEWGIPGTPHIS